MTDAVIAIDALLEELGYLHAEGRAEARRVLEAAGLTNPRKQNIAVDKRSAVDAALQERLARVCSDTRCERVAASDPRPHVRVDREHCQVCGGSANASGVSAMARALIEAGRPNLLVVGGSPNSHVDLRRLLTGTGIELRAVDGTVAIPEKRAGAWARWADVIVVWGGTQLGHRVSDHFLGPQFAAKRVSLVQRGIAALADAVLAHLAATDSAGHEATDRGAGGVRRRARAR